MAGTNWPSNSFKNVRRDGRDSDESVPPDDPRRQEFLFSLAALDFQQVRGGRAFKSCKVGIDANLVTELDVLTHSTISALLNWARRSLVVGSTAAPGVWRKSERTYEGAPGI